MPKFIREAIVFDAIQWFKDGAHEAVEPFDLKGYVNPDYLCIECGNKMREHGIILDGRGSFVCPGDYVTDNLTGHLQLLKQRDISLWYKLIIEGDSQK